MGLSRARAGLFQWLARLPAQALARAFGPAALFLLLAGCFAGEPVAVEGSLRRADAPIGASARFDASRITGDWYLRHGAAAKGAPAPRLHITRAAEGLHVSELAADGATLSQYLLLAGRAPGQFLVKPQVGKKGGKTRSARRRGGALEADLWLLWVDEGWRTMALGNPQGSIGAIYDRSAAGGADRIHAASEIMRWYGYAIGPQPGG